MTQSTPQRASHGVTPAHVAVIMDGNGRWAMRRGRPRRAGHLAGARATRAVVEAAARAGVTTLTLYAFSADNWARPAAEVRTLMRLFARYLGAESARCAADGVRLQVIGRRDRLDPALLGAVDAAERGTAAGRRLRVRLAIDYSARDAILAAATADQPLPNGMPNGMPNWMPNGMSTGVSTGMPDVTPTVDGISGRCAARDGFARAIARAVHDADPPGDVDLLVRTGGELRLSDFLLWECAYAELWFTDVLWPDFGPRDFAGALAAFARRQRRFGALPAVPDSAAPSLRRRT